MKKASEIISAFLLIICILFSLFSCSGAAGLTKQPDAPISDKISPQQPIREEDYEDLFRSIDSMNRRVSFLCAGDNVIHPALYMEAERRATAETRKYNFKPVYSDIVGMIEQADVAFINQETLMAGDEEYGLSGYPCFNSPRDLAYELHDLGFDIVNIANNHMLDKGASGLAKTIEFHKSLPYLMIGGYENREDYDTTRYYEVDGFKIAMLSYTAMTNGITLSPSSDLAIPYLDDETLRRHIRKAKESADLVFVSVHWGTENTTELDYDQKHYSALMAEEGVDVIIGHHPHVLQPIKWLDRADGGKTLCIYSLGNLVSEMEYSMNMIGGLVTFDIVVEGGGKPFIENVLLTPTIFYYGMNYFSTHIYLMEDYTEQLASTHGTRRYATNYSHTYTLETSKNFVRDNIDEEFLPDFLKATPHNSRLTS